MAGESSDACVLLSGGIDSAAMTHLLRERGLAVTGLYVDYGQAAHRCEQAAARRVATHFKLNLAEISIRGCRPKGAGEIACRNAMLCMLAAMERPNGAWAVAIGIHSGTPYLDCSQEFPRCVSGAFALQQRACVLITPFLFWSKGQIVAYARDCDIPLNDTYSCERGDETPCRACASCRDRSTIDAGQTLKA